MKWIAVFILIAFACGTVAAVILLRKHRSFGEIIGGALISAFLGGIVSWALAVLASGGTLPSTATGSNSPTDSNSGQTTGSPSSPTPVVPAPPPPGPPTPKVEPPPARPVAQADIFAGSLLGNGAFLQRYEGWERAVEDGEGGGSRSEIVSFSESRFGRALHIEHTGTGSIIYKQPVDVPGPDVVFWATFRASTREGPMIGLSGTGVVQIVLQYYDGNGALMGMSALSAV